MIQRKFGPTLPLNHLGTSAPCSREHHTLVNAASADVSQKERVDCCAFITIQWVVRIAYQRNDEMRKRPPGNGAGEPDRKGCGRSKRKNPWGSVPDEEVKATTTNTQVEGDEEAALLERLARREERRQKRLQEALERQKELDPTVTDAGSSPSSGRMRNDAAEGDAAEKEEKSESRRERYEIEETETATKPYQKNDWRDAEEKKQEDQEREEEEKPKRGSIKENQISAEEPAIEEERERGPDEMALSEKLEEEDRERAQAERVRLEAEERERIQAEQAQKIAEEKARMEAEEKAAAQERERREAEERERAEEEERQRAKAAEAEKAKLEEQNRAEQLEEKKITAGKVGETTDGKRVSEKKGHEDKHQTAVQKKQIKDEKIKKDKEPREEVKSILDGKKGFTEVKSQNGEFMTHKLKHTENTFSRSGGRASEAKEGEGASQVEAGKRLEELRRRRGETESEEFEKLKQKQQEAALELEELKKKREERRKILEEEEQRRKQEEAERKVREEEEKRRLKEEIERRRAEAAEKRQKMPEDGLADDKKPFKCFTPKGSSLKIEERAEFLNKSVQKSGVKSTHQAAVVSKIDSRLEQYTSAIEGTKAAKPMKPAASDLPVPAEGVRNIKSMWEKGNVFSSPTASGTPNKETAGLKVGVSSRINEWLTKTPDGNRSPAPKPSDLRPGDVSGKRNSGKSNPWIRSQPLPRFETVQERSQSSHSRCWTSSAEEG
ncbi:hypothetical protein QTO34_004701 [Cnephaeus nilssonii]|uniref:Caldesmon 1 n=1 Tax=Cnephaeus nilssonii TaxID=3371016 RepID=A0AA40HQN9_CNENI|nr:hypothetical protein QTO34_004701 [Eptesicus nilssonii]